jgi:haloalkane dehalogenase
MQNPTELPKKRVGVLGVDVAYVDQGVGPPVIMLHGNPTSSYIWRNVIPFVSPRARCIAPDLVGMGDSGKIAGDDPLRYSFPEHARYFGAFMDSLNLISRVVLVGQDWGGAIAMDWARRNTDRVRGIAYMETMVRPRTWAEMDPAVRSSMERMRSAEGESLLQDNIFIEMLLPARMLRTLTEEEMTVYPRPFLNAGEDRRPTLTFPRQIPVDGVPADVTKAVQDYADWMARNEVPKLFINGEPGAILVGVLRDFCRDWKNQEEITVAGTHFLQEDSPAEIGVGLADWIARLPKD